MIHPEKKTSVFLISISWIIVLIPLGWGVAQSVAKSVPLFQADSPAAAVGSLRGK